MSIQERIKQIRIDSGLTQEEFSAKIGLKRANYAQLETGKQLPTFETLAEIVRNFHTSYTYLIEGKESTSETEALKLEKKGKGKGKDLGKEASLKAVDKYANDLTHTEHLVDTSGHSLVAIADIRAAAGGIGYINPNEISSEDVIRLPNHMVKSGYHLCVRIKGPSMAPTFQDGGYLIIRLLDRSEWLNMRSEYCYVIVDTEGKTYFKRVKNRFSGENGGFIVCMSDNPDKTSHPNFNLRPDEIQYIWYVTWYLSAKMPNIHDQYYSRVSNLEDQVQILAEEFRNFKKQLK